MSVSGLGCGGSRVSHATQQVDGVRGETVDVWIESGGRALPLFFHEERYWLLATPGLAYTVHLANRTAGRVEAVVAVDGLDVVTHERADWRRHRGHVIDPGEEVAIAGWRDGDREVRAFVFTDAGAADATLADDGTAVGVIGVAVFAESEAGLARRAAGEAPPLPTPVAVDGATIVQATAAPGHLGTAGGEGRASEAILVPFSRLSPEAPLEVLTTYYDDADGLAAVGVVLPVAAVEPPPCHDGPQPFPGSPCADGFAPPAPPLE